MTMCPYVSDLSCGIGPLARPDRSFCPAGKGESDRRYQDGVQPLGREVSRRAKRARERKFSEPCAGARAARGCSPAAVDQDRPGQQVKRTKFPLPGRSAAELRSGDAAGGPVTAGGGDIGTRNARCGQSRLCGGVVRAERAVRRRSRGNRSRAAVFIPPAAHIVVPRHRGGGDAGALGVFWEQNWGDAPRTVPESTDRHRQAIAGPRSARSGGFGRGEPAIRLGLRTGTGWDPHRVPTGTAVVRTVSRVLGGRGRAPADFPSHQALIRPQRMIVGTPIG